MTIITESGPCVSVSVNPASFCISVLTSSKLWGPNCIGDDPLDVIEDWVGVRIWRYIPGGTKQREVTYLVIRYIPGTRQREVLEENGDYMVDNSLV